jgi:8-oxo-dGTP pyrophosphatase MutT (NUDIX family)
MTKSSKKHKKVQVATIAKNNTNGQNNYQLLLLQTNQQRGQFWQNMTGSVEADESFLEAAAREIQEETGISIEATKLIDLGLEFNFNDQWQREVTERCYLLLLQNPVEIKIDPKEHQAYVWKNIQDVNTQDFKFQSNYAVFKHACERLIT